MRGFFVKEVSEEKRVLKGNNRLALAGLFAFYFRNSALVTCFLSARLA